MQSSSSGQGFADLHHGSSPLVLPNCWDVGSALLFREAGFTAIGTTSLGLAAGQGIIDGSRAVRDLTHRLVQQISGLGFHVSVDIEDGFSESPSAVADHVQLLGASGVNIEDSTAGQLIDPASHAAKVAAVKARSPEVFVNARVDTFWLGESATVEATVARALKYVTAGADGVFVPGNLQASQITTLASAIPVPLNVLASPRYTAAQLGGMGVRRISTGSLPYRAALDAAVSVASGVRDGGLAPQATPYGAFQRLLEDYRRSRRP